MILNYRDDINLLEEEGNSDLARLKLAIKYHQKEVRVMHCINNNKTVLVIKETSGYVEQVYKKGSVWVGAIGSFDTQSANISSLLWRTKQEGNRNGCLFVFHCDHWWNRREGGHVILLAVSLSAITLTSQSTCPLFHLQSCVSLQYYSYSLLNCTIRSHILFFLYACPWCASWYCDDSMLQAPGNFHAMVFQEHCQAWSFCYIKPNSSQKKSYCHCQL